MVLVLCSLPLQCYPLLGLHVQLCRALGWNPTPVHPFALHSKESLQEKKLWELWTQLSTACVSETHNIYMNFSSVSVFWKRGISFEERLVKRFLATLGSTHETHCGTKSKFFVNWTISLTFISYKLFGLFTDKYLL